MAHPQVAVFARLADGNAPPTRRIEGQPTLLGRTMHAIEYDGLHDEIVLPQQFGQAILTFRGGANGSEPPIRVIRGSLTGLEQPDRLGVDPVNNEILVPEGDRILVFPREANGNVAPIRVLTGPDTQLGGSAVAVDTVNNLLVVGGSYGRTGQILIFDRKAEGNTKPLRVIRGPRTMLTSNGRSPRVYPPQGLIVMAHSGQRGNSFVGVWSINDNGDVPPRWTIGGPNGSLIEPRGVALDPKNSTVLVSDKELNAVMTYEFPGLFTGTVDTPDRRPAWFLHKLLRAPAALGRAAP